MKIPGLNDEFLDLSREIHKKQVKDKIKANIIKWLKDKGIDLLALIVAIIALVKSS